MVGGERGAFSGTRWLTDAPKSDLQFEPSHFCIGCTFQSPRPLAIHFRVDEEEGVFLLQGVTEVSTCSVSKA